MNDLKRKAEAATGADLSPEAISKVLLKALTSKDQQFDTTTLLLLLVIKELSDGKTTLASLRDLLGVPHKTRDEGVPGNPRFDALLKVVRDDWEIKRGTRAKAIRAIMATNTSESTAARFYDKYIDVARIEHFSYILSFDEVPGPRPPEWHELAVKEIKPDKHHAYMLRLIDVLLDNSKKDYNKD